MNKKHIKYIVIAIIGIVSFGSLFYFSIYIVPNLDPATSEDSSTYINPFAYGPKLPEVYNITLFIDYSGLKTPNELHQNINLTGGLTTVYHALITRCRVETKYFLGLGIMITAINEVSGNGWTYSVNGIPGPFACTYYNLKNNDYIIWKCVV
jgi:hypothetical protein